MLWRVRQFSCRNVGEVPLSVIMKEPGDRMRFGCQIWVSKDEGKCVNDIGMLDLLEKSVKNKKTTLGKHVLGDLIC